ncbi:MAG: universal stress protein [Bacteroidetes bacterium]|nr:MAG: universal stress protein [Bacteroidota bacterium]
MDKTLKDSIDNFTNTKPINMKSILFPTDFSPSSQNAFKYACLLARDIGARIDVITVFHLPASDVADLPADYYPRLIEEQEEVLENKLKAFTQNVDCEDVLGRYDVAYGMFVPQEITSFAKMRDYELIVMGTKGSHNIMEKLMGSITTHTMMQAPCPVLAVPDGAIYEKVEKIAYATDFSLNDAHSVKMLIGIAKEIGAETYFVHVETHAELGRVGDMIEIENYPFEFSEFSVVNHKSVMLGLDNYMEEKGIDWLSLFLPRRRLWERLFHSSFTRKMTFHTNKPVLVFHE